MTRYTVSYSLDNSVTKQAIFCLVIVSLNLPAIGTTARPTKAKTTANVIRVCTAMNQAVAKKRMKTSHLVYVQKIQQIFG